MSEIATPERGPIDHRELAEWVALSRAHGSDRRLHRVDPADLADDLENGDDVDVACETTLTSRDGSWQAKPAMVFPPGHHRLCQSPDCFGSNE